jgi:O-antigen/teichoic acid export membrane protein
LVTLVAANLVLVPQFGLMGAASAALLSITVWSAALWYTALKIAGVDVSIRARLRPPATLTGQPAE